jgi:hypothetical protein
MPARVSGVLTETFGFLEDCARLRLDQPGPTPSIFPAFLELAAAMTLEELAA